MSAEQTKQLEQALWPVAGRLRQSALRPRLVRAVYFGAAAAAVPALLRLFTGSSWWGVAGLLVLVGVPLLVFALTLAAKPNLRRAALAIDRHYDWQDRVTTAWSTLSVGGLTPLEQYQAQDAVQRMTQVSPRAVVPLIIPAGIVKSALLALFVLCALVWPISYHREIAKKFVAPVPETKPATPIELPPLPAVSSQLAVTSISQVKNADSPDSSSPPQDAPAPTSSLIQKYFEAVCPPGR